MAASWMWPGVTNSGTYFQIKVKFLWGQEQVYIFSVYLHGVCLDKECTE